MTKLHKKPKLATTHGYDGPPKPRKLPAMPGVEIYYPNRLLPLDLDAGFTLLTVNGGYAIKTHYPDLRPGEINFILR